MLDCVHNINQRTFLGASQELAGNEDDSYINSTWADTKTLKQHFSGVHDVRIPR